MTLTRFGTAEGIAMSANYGTPEERYKDMSAIYDDVFPFDAEAEATVSFLENLTPDGRALELGVGTGRIAIPLAERGCDVTGVDASPDMLRKLQSKDPEEKVHAIRADMATFDTAGEFDFIYTVWNSFAELHTQARQVACIASAARLLRTGGSLVIETGLAHHIFADQRPISLGPFDDLNTVAFQVMRYDQMNQIVEYRHISLGTGGIKVMSTIHRAVYLSELDLMARLGGLELTARYDDWTGGRFGAASKRHISAYAKTDPR